MGITYEGKLKLIKCKDCGRKMFLDMGGRIPWHWAKPYSMGETMVKCEGSNTTPSEEGEA